jgi:hypothetical protein
MADPIVSVKLLLTIIASLSGLQLVVFGYFARKYISRFENTESIVNQLKVEHCMIQKNKTSIK